LENVRAVRIEISYLMQYLIPAGSLQAVHVYFPDPWPKRRHRHHRIINEAFPSTARKVLQPGGKVFLRTDDADYFSQMQEVFGKDAHFTEIQTPGELAEVVTDFEREFNARGIPTLRAAYSLSS
jgi:tRNA (guanine-N7-)-methyltransferase